MTGFYMNSTRSKRNETKRYTSVRNKHRLTEKETDDKPKPIEMMKTVAMIMIISQKISVRMRNEFDRGKDYLTSYSVGRLRCHARSIV
jgi:hypothetical protein